MEDKLRDRIEKGVPTPFYDTRPLLYDDLQEVFEIWNLLSIGRSRGMAVETVKLSEILAAFSLYSIYDSEERKTYIMYIYALEDVFLKWCNTQKNSKSNE